MNLIMKDMGMNILLSQNSFTNVLPSQKNSITIIDYHSLYKERMKDVFRKKRK